MEVRLQQVQPAVRDLIEQLGRYLERESCHLTFQMEIKMQKNRWCFSSDSFELCWYYQGGMEDRTKCMQLQIKNLELQVSKFKLNEAAFENNYKDATFYSS